MDKKELEEEIQSLQMTCYEQKQKIKQLMRVNAELRKGDSNANKNEKQDAAEKLQHSVQNCPASCRTMEEE